MNIREYLKKHKMIADGAMGTYFASLENTDIAVSESANIWAPEKIEEIHREYIRAGAQLIRTNTFAANKEVLLIDEEELSRMIKKAYKIAQMAIQKERAEAGDTSKETPIFIAGDIGPIPESSISNEEELFAEYKLIVDAFLEEGAQILLFETFADLIYLRPLVAYIKEKSPDCFIITNFCINWNGYTASGVSARKLLQEISQIEEIDACGFNCGVGSGHMFENLRKLPFPNNKFLISMPNAGYPEQMQNRMVFADNISYFVNNMRRIAGLGIDVIGGCCGTTPDYIRALKEQVDIAHTGRGVRVALHLQEEAPVVAAPNDFYELFATGRKVVAVELDPPFEAQYEKMVQCAHELKKSGADIITIADSPMGRSRADSILMSLKIGREVGLPVMPHVCCRDKNMIAMRSTLLGAYINDIRNLLIVTGDPVPNDNRASITGVFDYNSIQLMRFVNEMNEEHFAAEPFYYGGALNYGRGKIEKVVERMQQKIEAGAKYFLTQPIYAPEDIERIAYIKAHVDTKILCGIMPLVSYRNANFIKNEMTGIHVPDEIVARYHPDMTKEQAELVGAQIANELIEQLSPYADGYYFMLPFNRTSLMNKIIIK